MSDRNGDDPEYMPVGLDSDLSDEAEEINIPKRARRRLFQLSNSGITSVLDGNGNSSSKESNHPSPSAGVSTIDNSFESQETINTGPDIQSSEEEHVDDPTFALRLVDYSSTDSEKSPMKIRPPSRKRKRMPSQWKQNIRKEKHQHGEEYVNRRGVTVPKKEMKTLKDCNNCKYKCSETFTQQDRVGIKDAFYALSQDAKYNFINQNSDCGSPKRGNALRKARSFSYFFFKNEIKFRVCKMFFLGTLVISQKVVYNVHAKKNTKVNVTKTDARGTKTSATKSRLSTLSKDRVRNHIRSFPCAESHYCRAKTVKEYLDPSLNQAKMYDLYVEKCAVDHVVPVSISMYRHIFNYEFNKDFLQPKSDRCDCCEEYLSAKMDNRLDDDLTQKYEAHIIEKEQMRMERELDKNEPDINRLVVCFDLQNVISLPRAQVSCVFYKRKLNVYNMTAHVSVSKKGYCAVWSEALIGRSGNDIASSVVTLFEKIMIDYPDTTHIVTWSDSCVPQNRNSLISLAMATFLTNHPQLESITMKYSTPGHSCIQQVDNMHACIEKVMKHAEIWSPVSLIRILKTVNRKSPFTIIQLNMNHFHDYQTPAKTLTYQTIPYTKISQIRFHRDHPFHVEYKLSHGDAVFQRERISISAATRKRGGNVQQLPAIKQANIYKGLSLDKKKDIQSMYRWMPTQDKNYFEALFR